MSTITRKTVAQYEALRRLGPCNMLDYCSVIANAEQLSLHELASLEHDDYMTLLFGYSDFIEQYEIDQSMSPFELALQT